MAEPIYQWPMGIVNILTFNLKKLTKKLVNITVLMDSIYYII